MLIHSRYFLAASLCLIFTACSSPTKVAPPPQSTVEIPTPALPAEQLIGLAYASQDSAQKAHFLLKAAQHYYENNLIAQSSSILGELDYESLSTQERVSALLLNLDLGLNHALDQHTSIAVRVYDTTPLDKINMDDLSNLIPLLATALSYESNHLASALLLIEYEGILNNISLDELNNTIWEYLRKTDPLALFNLKISLKDQNSLAWIELIQSIQQNQSAIEKQFTAFQVWKEKWPNHPINQSPPKELRLLSQLPETRPKEIILALPLSGPLAEVGKAVRDGFMASYINDLNTNPSQETFIRFFNTHTQDLSDLYLQNRSEDTLIIGPLTKENVNKLAILNISDHQTLALNYLDAGAFLEILDNRNLYQFGLDPETEINQLSQLFTKKNLNKIAYIAPDTEHGYRIHDSLQEALLKQQSSIIESVYYQNQKSLSPSVAQLLATDKSKDRKDKIKRITQLNMEFEPRRRKDIDAIFMLAKPKIASQLNPLFAYHFASDLPIYASSQIHEPKDTQHDLDNILFVEMPWMLSQSIDIKKIINNAREASRNDYSRFYALGADAFKLSPRLTLLKEIKDTQIQGHTGTLSVNQNGIILRELQLAHIKKGKAIAIKD